MSLEGLRAWIGEVERKLGKRTRVFLALAVIAIGLGGAAIYLAIDARESSVSESDVQELQKELEARIDEATGSPAPAAEPVEPAEPAPEEPQPKSGQNGKDGGTGGIGAVGESSGSGAPTNAAGSAKVQELLEQAKEQSAEAEAEQAGK